MACNVISIRLLILFSLLTMFDRGNVSIIGQSCTNYLSQIKPDQSDCINGDSKKLICYPQTLSTESNQTHKPSRRFSIPASGSKTCSIGPPRNYKPEFMNGSGSFLDNYVPLFMELFDDHVDMGKWAGCGTMAIETSTTDNVTSDVESTSATMPSTIKSTMSTTTKTIATTMTDEHWTSKSKFFKKQIVHLDLKGAAPRPEFLLELFPFFKSLGFNGVLVEYEDMFPYSAELSKLARKTAYNETTIAQLIKAANDSGLEYISLIQTFGHMEFALKHPEFDHLREDHEQKDCICPSKDESIWLISEILKQIRRLHPLVKSIHIGCDEAWTIAKDEACQLRLNTTLNRDIDRLKMDHISRVARMAKEEFMFAEVYAWHDMFDNITVPLMSEYKLGSLLIPVVWGYARDVYFPKGLFERYSQVFDEVHFAGAYKGADGFTQQFVDIDRYQQNLYSYQKLYQKEQHLENRLRGIVLTGWQRYCHERPLCELLPAGIPALAREAIFLSQWNDQNVPKAQLDRQLRTFLNCPEHPTLAAKDLTYEGVSFRYLFEVQLGECKFPGVELYEQLEQWNVLLWKIALDRKHRADGNELSGEHRQELNKIWEKITQHLGRIYYEDTVTEWLKQHEQMDHFANNNEDMPRFDPILPTEEPI